MKTNVKERVRITVLLRVESGHCVAMATGIGPGRKM
jgi:hypothetical protein